MSVTGSAGATGRGGARRRGGPVRCVVTDVSHPTPRMVRVALSGAGLVGVAPTGPDQRVKLAFPRGRTFGDDPAEAGAARRRRRTYTLLDLDGESGTAAVEFVVHGGGLAGEWAQRAEPGDELDLTGPVGGHDLAGAASERLLVCDETGLPALVALLDARAATGDNTPTRVYVEAHDPAERRALPPVAGLQATWLWRSGHPGAAPGDLVAGLAPELILAPEGRAWIAGEAAAVRALRTRLVADLGVPRAQVDAVAYWTAGHAEGDPAEGRPGEAGRRR